MNDFKDILNSGISDELLAAYIDGNTTDSENALIESTLNDDSILSEACEIASDSVSFGSNFDWELHKGDFGFWEFGLPPVVTETVIDQQTNIEGEEKLSIPSVDETIVGVEPIEDDINNYNNTISDLNLNDY